MRPKRGLALNVAIAVAVTLGSAYGIGTTSATATLACSGVIIASGANIQTAVDSHTAGTTFCLAGNYATTTPITPKDGDQFIGTTTTNISSSGAGVFVAGKSVTYDNLGIGPSRGDGIRPGSWSIVQNSIIHDNSNCGITTVGNWLVIANNEITHNGLAPTSPSQACGVKIRGMQGSDTGAYSTISGNIVHDNGHNALWVDCDGHDNVFSNNVIYGNSGIALDEETSYHNTFTGNTVHDNGFGMSLAAVSILDSTDGIFTNNTLTNNYAGVRVWADRRATVSAPKAGMGCANASLTGYIPSGITLSGNLFKTEQRVGFGLSGVTTTAATFDFNCYTVAQLTDTNWQLPGTTRATWTQWRSAGEDLNGAEKTVTC
jgi:parallel beta-helix repeat protein